MGSFYGVVEEGNKFNGDLSGLWTFRICGLQEIVGFMRPEFVKEIKWDPDYFSLDEGTKTVYARPNTLVGETEVSAVQRAFRKLAISNRGKLDGCFDKWFARPEARQDYSSVLSTDKRWLHINMPSPARGVFGIVTAGVHLNVYTVKPVAGREEVDKIWVSQRARDPAVSYPGLLDQVVAGGIEPYDLHAGLFAPYITLRREAQEEAGLQLDVRTRDMIQVRNGKEFVIGKVCEAEPIMFYDKKNAGCGRGEEGHLEPGIRFVYDLKVQDAGFRPQKREASVEKFEAYSPREIKTLLRGKKWKPNCGLVMLDFMMRKQLIVPEEDERFHDIKMGLRRQLPFKYIKEGMPSMGSWESALSHG